MKKTIILILAIILISMIGCGENIENKLREDTSEDVTTASLENQKTNESLKSEETSESLENNRTKESLKNQKSTDLHYFYETLKTGHPNLFTNISEAELELEIEKIDQAIPSMSDTDFYYSLKSLLSKIGDAHTTVYLSDEDTKSSYKYPRRLPIVILNFGDDWHIAATNQENESYLGSKLIAINGTTIDEVFELCKSIMSFENNQWAKENFSNSVLYKEALEFIGVVKKEEPIIFTVENTQNTQTDIKIIPLTEDESFNDNDIIWFQSDAVPITRSKDIYRGLPLDENTFFIQYNACREDPSLPMSDFRIMMKEEITQGEYSTLVIDLRYNSGGNRAIIIPLLANLRGLQNKCDIKVYTLIGKATFSSGLRNSIDTIDLLNSTLVGTPTGGNVKGYTELQEFPLGNQPIIVSHSTKYYEYISDYTKDSLYPDFEIIRTFADYASGIDPEIQWILEQN